MPAERTTYPFPERNLANIQDVLNRYEPFIKMVFAKARRQKKSRIAMLEQHEKKRSQADYKKTPLEFDQKRVIA